MKSNNLSKYPLNDLLYGAKAVAEFLGVKKSVAVHLMRARLIPAFPLGDVHCCRRSTLTHYFNTLEAERGERR